MDLLVTAIIAVVCFLVGLAIGYMSRNSKIDRLTADRDRANARADKLSESLNEARRSAEADGESRSVGGWHSPTGRREKPRRSAYGTVQPMPRQYPAHAEEDTTVYVPPAPYEYETVRYEETRTERTEEPRTEPAYEPRTETYSAPDTGSSSYGGSDFDSSGSSSDSSSW